MKYLVTSYNLAQVGEAISEDGDRVFTYYNEAVEYAEYLCEEVGDDVFIFEIHLKDFYEKKPAFVRWTAEPRNSEKA